MFDFIQLCQTEKKGFGLLTTKSLEANELVTEYTGVVKFGTPLSNSYTVDLDAEKLFVDASSRGGFARFVNHSFDPNCHLEVYEVSVG